MNSSSKLIRGVFSSVLLVLIAACLMTPAWGQATSSSTVSGIVTDQQGAAIVGATIKMLDRGTGAVQTQTSNESGRYIFTNVQSGDYTITVTREGFSTFRVDNQKVEVGGTLTLNPSLAVGATSTTIEVQATVGAELQTTSASVGTSLSGKALEALPNMGRDVTTLAVLQPGTTLGGYTAGAVQDQNTYTLDGGNNSDDMAGNNTSYVTNFTGTGGSQTNGNSSGVMPTPIESIEEFRVSSFNQTADFNSSIGGQVVMATKRGTNQWHGSGYGYYFATNVGAANNWVANHTPVTLNGVAYDHTPLPSNHRLRNGASLGGPLTPKILGGKTYFFVNYERLAFPNVSTYERVVPSVLMRAGIIQVQNSAGVYLPYNLNPTAVTVNGTTYQPANCAAAVGCDPRGIGINPIVNQIWQKQMPLPNDPNFSSGDNYNTQGYLSTIRAPLNSNSYVARIDHDFNEKWRLMSSYRYLRLTNLTTNQVDIGGALPGDTFGQPAASAPRNQVPSFFVAGLTTNIKPTLTNNFIFNYTRNFWQWGTANAPPQIPGLGGAVEIANGGGGSAESLNALIPYNVNTQNVRQRFWDGQDKLYKDDLTWIKGKHLFQFGASYQRNFDYHQRTDNGNGVNNQIVYQVTSSGISFTNSPYIPTTIPTNQVSIYSNLYSEVLGLVNQPQVAYARAGANLTLQPVGAAAFDQSIIPTYNLYASDTWHIKPTLTLTYGLGYALELPPYELNGKQVALVDTAGKAIDTDSYLAARKSAALAGSVFNPTIGFATISNVAGKPKYPYNPVKDEFSPRLAAAWNPRYSNGLLGKVFGDGKTVIRGGYGRIYGRLNGVGLVLVPLLGPGLLQAVSCTGASKFGTCLGSGQVDPSTAFRIGTDGLTAPLPSVSQNLAQPFFPGVAGNPLSTDPSVLDPNYRPERTDNFTLSIQRQISRNSTLEIGYISRIIRNETQEINLDAVPYMTTLGGQAFSQAWAAVYNQVINNGVAPATLGAQPFFEAALGGGASSYCKAAANCTAAVVGANTSLLRNGAVSDFWSAMNKASSWTLGRTMMSSLPTQVTSVGMITANGYGNYNALFVTYRMRDHHGLTAVSNFTYGRALGSVSSTQATSAATVLDPWNLSAMYGPQSFDIKLIYNVAMFYQTPFFKNQKGVVGHLLGGWTISPLFTAQSGAPTSPSYTEGSCTACQAFGEATPPSSLTTASENAVLAAKFTGGSSANYNVPGSGGVGTNNPFGVNIFADPATVITQFRKCILGFDQSCGGYGNIRGLSTYNLDAGILKQIGIWQEGRVGATLSFQFTNVLNHEQPGGPALSITTPSTFGRITTQANTPRNMEFGLRIFF